MSELLDAMQKVKLPKTVPNSDDIQVCLQVSQPDPVIPSGFDVTPDLISDLEGETLTNFFYSNPDLWLYQGFEKRFRVQTYSINDLLNNDDVYCPQKLKVLIEKVREHVNSDDDDDLYDIPQELIVEERYASKFIKEERAGRLSSNAFETLPFMESSVCPCHDNSDRCSCYVGHLALSSSNGWKTLMQFMDKPIERRIESWDIETPNHNYGFVMEKNTLITKKGESFWNWRSRIAAYTNSLEDANKEGIDTSESNRCIVLKFIHTNKANINHEEEKKEENDEIDFKQLYYNRPLEELLTIVVTTSPIKSNPSTEVLEKTFETFVLGGHAFAFKCPKVIVCDGCRILGDEVQGRGGKTQKISKKYSNAKQSLRNGIATNDQAENYRLFKVGMNKLCADAASNETSPFHNARVVELDDRHGYGFALRHALYHEVKTPYVCVIQHDRTFMRRTPMEEVVRAMINKEHGDIKYVGISMRSNLSYRDIFNSKYGRSLGQELLDMVIYPEELKLDSSLYGPNGSSLDDIEVVGKLRKTLDSIASAYQHNIQCKSHTFETEEGKHQLSLTPTLYWYDNTHIVETSHYRDYIFNPHYRMVARGGFVEDRLSPLITRSVERLGLKKGHDKFKSYLLDDHSGYFFTGHLDGGSYISQEEKDKLKKGT